MNQTRSVKDLMSTDVMTIADDMPTDAAARYLIEHEISGAPVVDEQGLLVGVLSMTDIGRSVAEPSEVGSSSGSGFYRDDGAEVALDDVRQRYAQEPAARVRDVMTPAVHQVTVTASVAEVARRMMEQHVHRLVVTNGKEPVGIITSLDMLKLIAG
jgi:predicted transcriptional regulator